MPGLAALALLVAPPAAPVEEPARAVVAAVRSEAERNARLPKESRKTGDELTELYVRAAVVEARKLPAKKAVPALLVGLGIALDDSTILRRNPLTAALCRRVENDADRKARLAVLGSPTVRGRRDLCQHFVVSCALTEIVGASGAEAAGLLKEQMDSMGGSGFSFVDLTANLAGIQMATRLKKGDSTLAGLEKFRVLDHMPAITGLREGFQAADFAKEYGSFEDERFKAEVNRIRERVSKVGDASPRR